MQRRSAITPGPSPRSGCGLADRLRVLKGDKKAVFTAAGDAQRAADFVLAFRGAGSGSARERGPLSLAA